MKIKKYKQKVKFKGKYCKGMYYYDGSGFLEVTSTSYIGPNGKYFRDDYIHSDRVKDIKLLSVFYTKAYKELKKISKKISKLKVKS